MTQDNFMGPDRLRMASGINPALEELKSQQNLKRKMLAQPNADPMAISLLDDQIDGLRDSLERDGLTLPAPVQSPNASQVNSSVQREKSVPPTPAETASDYTPGVWGQKALALATQKPRPLTNAERRARDGFVGFVHNDMQSLKDGIAATAELGKDGYFNKSHQNRNHYNHVPATWQLAKKAEWNPMSADDSVYHRFAANAQFNKKYTSPDGHHEAVYDHNNNLVRDPRNMGTFHYSSPEKSLAHFRHDVLPYYLNGNGPKDATWIPQRLIKSLEWAGMPHDYLLSDPDK